MQENSGPKGNKSWEFDWNSAIFQIAAVASTFYDESSLNC